MSFVSTYKLKQNKWIERAYEFLGGALQSEAFTSDLAREHFLRMDKTLYIGDDVRDCEAAYNAECGSVLVANSEEYELIKNKPKWNINVDKLSDAVSEIKSFMEFQGI